MESFLGLVDRFKDIGFSLRGDFALGSSILTKSVLLERGEEGVLSPLRGESFLSEVASSRNQLVITSSDLSISKSSSTAPFLRSL